MKGDKRMLKTRRMWERKVCYRTAVVMAILSISYPISVVGQEKAGQGANGEVQGTIMEWEKSETGEDSEAAKARRACFGEDVYPQICCLVADGKWLRNPG